MFDIDKCKMKKLEEWQREQRDKIIKETPHFPLVYLPFIYTYSFSPTNVGIKIVVNNSVTGDTIDLTDYSEW